MTSTQKLGAAILCAMTVWTSLALAASPTIDSAIVNLSSNEIAIGGAHLIPASGSPVVMLDAMNLTVLSSANTKIVANLPSGLADGTYRLSVNNGSPTVAVIGIAIGAGSLALPYTGSASSTSSVLNIANTGPGGNTTAVSGQGGASATGSGNQGGTGVGAYGGNSSGGGSVAGTGLFAHGGAATATQDIGGKGLNANGGNGASGTATGGGSGLWATGGTAGSAGGQGGDGVDAFAGISTGNGYPSDALYAVQYDLAGYAGEFIGNVLVAGNLSKSGGSFKIDDPIDPANKYLYHSFVESPDMKNVYDGNVVTDGNGSAIITMPAWFEALNSDYRYQLTVIGQPAHAWIAAEMMNSAFSIKTDRPNVKVSWQVTGIRQDAWARAHRIPVEVDKAPEDKGRYIHPELFGHPDDPGIAQSHHADRQSTESELHP
jgi:hypothetical protein